MTFPDEITEVSPSQQRIVRDAEQRRATFMRATYPRHATRRRFIPRYTIAQLVWSVPECDWPTLSLEVYNVGNVR